MAEQAYAYVTLIPVAKGFQSAIAKELAGIPEMGAKAGMNLGGKLLSGFGSALKGGAIVAGVTAAAVAGIAVALKPAIDASSALYAETEGVKQIFGEAAQSVINFGETAAMNFGLSEVAALQAAKNFGGFATSAGLSGKAAADFSTQLVGAAGDLASFADVPVEEALAAIESGLSGQSEPLRKFQIFIDDTTLKAYAMEQGLADTYDTMTQGEKAILRQEAILDQLGVKQGDFVNYQDTYGNALKTITSTFENMTAQIGDALMPAVEAMTIQFRDALGEIGDATTPVGEAWNELIGTFEAFGETVSTVFGDIDLPSVLAGIFDFVQMLINGMSQLVWVAGDAGKTIGMVFSGDFAGAGKQFDTFFSRYNSFVDGLYQKADAAALRAKVAQDMGNTTEVWNRPNLSGASSIVPKTFTPSGATGPTKSEINASIKQLIKDSKDAVKDARKDYNKAIADANYDFAKRNLDITDTYNKDLGKAQERYSNRVADINKSYAKSIAKATQTRDAGMASALKANNAAILKIQSDFAKSQSDIINQSMNRLRDAYKGAVEINVASIFNGDVVAGSIDGTIQLMRDKLAASRQLLANAAALSAAGFSQVFIEQVVGAGTDVGNELATSILNATPEQRAEMQSLFSSIDTEASHGMDTLAQTMYEKNGLATEALKSMYDQTYVDLANSLAEQETLYAEQQAQILLDFDTAVAEAEVIRNEALDSAQNDLDQSILDAKLKRDEALADAEETLRGALLRANESFNDDLARIQKAFDSKIAAMKGAVGSMSASIRALDSQLATAQAKVSTKITALQPTFLATGGLVTKPTSAVIGEAGPEVVIPLDRFESMMGMTQGNGSAINYYAAPNQSLDAEQQLFDAMKRAKVVVGW